MFNFIKNNLLTIVFGISTFVLSLWLFTITTQQSKPVIYIDEFRAKIIDKDKIQNAPVIILNREDSLEIIDNVTLLRFKVCNEGRKIIRSHDVKDPITISLVDSTCKIIDKENIFARRSFINHSTEITGRNLNELVIYFDVLEKRKDFIMGQIFFSGNPETDVKVSGSILESDEIQLKFDPKNIRKEFSSFQVILYSAISTFIAFLLSLFLIMTLFTRVVLPAFGEAMLKLTTPKTKEIFKELKKPLDENLPEKETKNDIIDS